MPPLSKIFDLLQYNLKNKVSFTFRELGIGIVPYSPLGRGFFGGRAVVESLPSHSYLVRN